jgi:hypothetical protein
MATTYITPLDNDLVNSVAASNNDDGVNLSKQLSAAPTFTDKFKVAQALALKYATNTPIVDAATQWLKDNSGDLYDSSTATYLADGTYRNALLESDIKGKPLQTLFTKINQLRTDNVSNALKDTAPNLAKTEFDTEVTNLTNGSKTTAYDPAKYIAVASKGTPAIAYKKGMTADQLKTNYGSLIDPTTKKPVFTNQQLEDVASGKASASAFNKKINSLATDAVNKSQDWSLYGGKTGSAYVSAIKNMVSDPSKLATVYKAPDVTNTPVKEGSGIDALTTPITTTGTKVGQVPSLKTWHAPQQGIATANSPYSGLLDATLAKVTGANFGTPTNNAVYKNLTDPLTQGMGLDSLVKPKLTYDTNNTAGITGLGDVKGTLQSLNADSLAKQQAAEVDKLRLAQPDWVIEKDRLAQPDWVIEKDRLAKEAYDKLHPKNLADAPYASYADMQAAIAKSNRDSLASIPSPKFQSWSQSVGNTLTDTQKGDMYRLNKPYFDTPVNPNAQTVTLGELSPQQLQAQQQTAAQAMQQQVQPSTSTGAVTLSNSDGSNPYQGLSVNPYTPVQQQPVTSTGAVTLSNPYQGIASDASNITSPSFMNTSATGPNGQSGIVSVLPQPTNTVTLGELSPQQLQAQQQTAAQAMQQQAQPVTSTGSVRLG